MTYRFDAGARVKLLAAPEPYSHFAGKTGKVTVLLKTDPETGKPYRTPRWVIEFDDGTKPPPGKVWSATEDVLEPAEGKVTWKDIEKTCGWRPVKLV